MQVLVGIESLEEPPRHAGMGAKSAPVSRVLAAVERIQDAGVPVIGCFIVGADGDDEASIERLGDRLEAAPFADVQVTLSTPFPGTALERRLRESGRILPDADWSHYTLFDVVHRPDRMTPEALTNSFRRLVARVFAEGPSARRTELRRDILRRARGISEASA